MLSKLPRLTIHIRTFLGMLAGPWKVNPFFTALLFSLLYVFSAVRVGVSQGRNAPLVWLESIPIGLVSAFLCLLCIWGLNKTVERVGSLRAKQICFHLGLLLTSSILLGFNVLYSGGFGSEFFVFTVIRIYIGALALAVVAGLGEKKLLAQIQRAEAALIEVDRQRNLLLHAEENVRREVANYLHDRVQAGLVVTGIELERIAQEAPEKSAKELASVIEELEEIRIFEIRNASHILSPDISIIGLRGCLEELFVTYRNSMTISFREFIVIEDTEKDIQLAIFRIIEQGLLNALIHGKASLCQISVTPSLDGKILLTLENNGVPLGHEDRNNGTGTAVIDAWTQRYQGKWSLINTESHTVELRVRLTHLADGRDDLI